MRLSQKKEYIYYDEMVRYLVDVYILCCTNSKNIVLTINEKFRISTQQNNIYLSIIDNFHN